MMIKTVVSLMIGTLLIGLHAASALAEDRPRLKDAFQGDFVVGAALSGDQIMGRDPDSMKLVEEQFNAISPENCLKWESVHPEPDRFDFEQGDRYVEFGEKNGMFILGHTLVWHNQTPSWAFQTKDGKPLDRATALANLKKHIDTVVGRYKGRVKAWDVVNEAIDDEGKFRNGPTGAWPRRGEPWHAAIGDDYIEQAFRMAHAADPDAEMYYNDYNEWYPAKIEAISKLITDLKSKGVRIDGLGLQGHWGIDYPQLDEIDHMLTEYGKLGIKLMITELDVSVIPTTKQQIGAEITQRLSDKEAKNPYADGLPADKQQELAARYAAFFKLFMKHRDKIDRITFWGVNDKQSWRNGWPAPGRADYPLLFDRQLQPKPSFEAVIETATMK